MTGFEPFGTHAANPTEGLAKAVNGRRIGDCAVVGAVLPVHHAEAATRVAALLAETNPEAVLHLGLAAGRARVALERVAVNVMDYEVADNAGFRASGERRDCSGKICSMYSRQSTRFATSGAGRGSCPLPQRSLTANSINRTRRSTSISVGGSLGSADIRFRQSNDGSPCKYGQ